MQRSSLFPYIAALFTFTFFAIMLFVLLVANLRTSGHTGLDMGKLFEIQRQSSLSREP